MKKLNNNELYVVTNSFSEPIGVTDDINKVNTFKTIGFRGVTIVPFHQTSLWNRFIKLINK